MQSIVHKLFHFSRSEVRSFFEHGESLKKDSHFVFLKNPKTHVFARLLVVTPRKIGSAPARNTVRRRLKALFYESGLFKTVPFDCAVIVRPAGMRLPFDQLKATLETVLGTQKG